MAEAANETKITVYRTTAAEVTITNTRGKQQTYLILFVVVDLKQYLIYLSLP
jgi:hypothetical protein